MIDLYAYNPDIRPANGAPTVHAICPGCGALTNFEVPTSKYGQASDLLYINFMEVRVEFGLRICPSCHHVVFFAREDFSNSSLFLYPPAGSSFTIKNVPKDIEADAKEAMACFRIGAFKATVVMCRRVMQASCKERSGVGKNLKEQIDSLQAQDIINKQLKDWAHQIRHFGNFGAHPDEDFGDVTPEDAEQITGFMNMFLKYVYEMPAMLEAAQNRSGKS